MALVFKKLQFLAIAKAMDRTCSIYHVPWHGRWNMAGCGWYALSTTVPVRISTLDSELATCLTTTTSQHPHHHGYYHYYPTSFWRYMVSHWMGRWSRRVDHHVRITSRSYSCPLQPTDTMARNEVQHRHYQTETPGYSCHGACEVSNMDAL